MLTSNCVKNLTVQFSIYYLLLWTIPAMIYVSLIFLLMAPAVVVMVYFYSNKKLSYWSRRGVKQLSDSHWLFGDFKNGIIFKTSPGTHLGEIYKKAKDDWKVFGFYIFFKPCLMLRDPELIKQILIRDFDNFSDRNFAGNRELESTGMRNLFGVKKSTWRYLRQRINPTFSVAKLKKMIPLMLETGDNMLKHIEKNRKNGVDTFDVQELSYLNATDLIASIALGIKTDSFTNLNAEFTKDVLDFLSGFRRMVALVLVFFVPKLVDWFGATVLFNFKCATAVFWRTLAQRERTGEKRGDYIDAVIHLKNGKQDPIYSFEGKNLLYQSGMFFSGFESSANTATFTLMELARHPEYQNRARDEVWRAVQRHGWSYEAFNDMKYLDQCISEGMRLHSPVPMLDRIAKEDYKLPGTDIIIEKGTAIYISLCGLQDDPKHFPEPELFNPDRFAAEEKVSDAYVAFGAGPRMCVGMKMGQFVVKLVLSKILFNYGVSYNEEKVELDPRYTFTAANKGMPLEFRAVEKRGDQFDVRSPPPTDLQQQQSH